MKPAIVPAMRAAGVALAMLAPARSNAQQSPTGNPARMTQVPAPERTVGVDVQRQNDTRGADRDLQRTFQMLEFAFATGDDDLRDDTSVSAGIVFPDGSRVTCPLHGRGTAGGVANVSWGNNSKHTAPPCHLARAQSLDALRHAKVIIAMVESGPGVDPAAAVFGGPIGLAATLHTNDNWNINEAAVWAYNPGTPGKACVISVGGNPVARLTGDQPRIRLTDYPNRCH